MLCQEIHIEIRLQFKVFQMYLEYFNTLLEIRQIYMYLTVKASGTEQSLVEYVCPVGRCKDNHA